MLSFVDLRDTVTLRLMHHGLELDFQAHRSVLNEFLFNTSQTTSVDLPRHCYLYVYALFSLSGCWSIAIDRRIRWLLFLMWIVGGRVDCSSASVCHQCDHQRPSVISEHLGVKISPYLNEIEVWNYHKRPI